ncbi:MAG: sugar ABC transporter permease [Fusobacteriota bacterium]
MAKNQNYTKKEFYRSLFVVLVSLAVFAGIITYNMRKTKKTVKNDVKVSSEFFSNALVNEIKDMSKENPLYKRLPSLLFGNARNTIQPKNFDTFIPEDREDEISNLGVEAVAVWKEKDGELVNMVHTIDSYNKKGIYGIGVEEKITESNVKRYFRLKLENDWIVDTYKDLSEYNLENLDNVLERDDREVIHTLEKFQVNDENYYLNIQYSKQSIKDNRITKKTQVMVIKTLFIYLVFLLVYSLIMDRRMLMHVLILYALIFAVYPLTWITSLTFKSTNALGGTTLNPIPKNATLDNYKEALFNLNKVTREGAVLEGDEILVKEAVMNNNREEPKVLEKNIKSVYNVFDPQKTNLWEEGKGELITEEEVEYIEYNEEQREIRNHIYKIKLETDPKMSKDSQIYNIEYYTYENKRFISGIRNSLFIAFSSALLSVVLASAAGYSFSRFKFPGKEGFMMSFLVTQMFPGTTMLIPLYIIFSNLGLIDTFRGLILAFSITSLPFNIWNLKGFFDTVPQDLEEAALIDGCSASQTFYKIVLPLSLPALAISGLFAFMNAWNEYILAATFTNTESKYPIAVVIKQLVGSNSVDWPMFATMSVLVSIPVVIVFLMSQKYLVSGLTAGGVKG